MFAFLKKGKIRKKALLIFLFTILVLTGSFFVYKYTKAIGVAKMAEANGGLIGYWNLDEADYNSTNSRVTDKSPFENHGTNSGATFAADRFGKAGGAMSFNGVDNYLKVSNFNSGLTKNFTASFWAKFDTYSYMHLISAGENISSATFNFKWRMSGQYPYWNYYNSTGAYVGAIEYTVIPSLNEWHLYTLTYDGASIKAYLDGDLNNSVVINYEIYIPNALWIASNNSEKMKGALDDVRIYNRALSEEEIKSLYDSYSPKTSTGSLQQGLILDMPLKSYYTKNETAGSQIMTDRTAYSRDGRNYGATITESGAIFDGVNDSVGLGLGNDFFPLPKFSICTWAKTPGVASGMTENGVFSMTYGLVMKLSASGEALFILDNGIGVSILGAISTNLNDNKYHQVCISHDGSSQRIFVDGDLKNSQISAWSGVTRWPTNSVSIGTNVNNTSVTRFNGEISNVLIYNRALSEDEVKTLYNRGRSDVGIMFQTKN